MRAVDLGTHYLGLALRTPLVASSCPLTGNLDDLRRLEDAGAAAVVLPSLFEEQLEHEALEIHRMLETGAQSFGEAASYFPELDDYRTGPGPYLELLAAAKAALAIPVIASLNGASPGGWTRYARALEEAGADAVELNLYTVAADPAVAPETIEAQARELVAEVRAAVRMPLSVKLSPFYTSLAHTARRLVDAGADGLVLFNRFYQPELDLDTLEVTPHLHLSTPDELRLPVRWIAILRGRLEASLAATSGVHGAEDALRALLAGADAVMLASVLLERGPAHLAAMERGVARWMEEHEYASVRQLCGSMCQAAITHPERFERANYLQTLRSFASGHG
jgi:dihydroorotate dehydrogenase (fumarate)